MRVAIVHSFYSSQQPSGENAQVRSEVAALRRAGVEVELIAAHTDELERSPAYPIRTALRVGTRHGADPLAALAAAGPDIVHVHNLFPNYGRSWVGKVQEPVVATLHNFRPVCANGVLSRDGRPCFECVEHGRGAALRHRCYRGSLAATLPVVLGQRGGAGSDPLLTHADRVLCLSERQVRLLADGGLPADRLVAWSNFVPDSLDPGSARARTEPGARRGCLVVGRLSEEKGVLELIEAWSGAIALTIVGDGPLLGEARRLAAGRNVEVVGALPREAVLDLMTTSSALVMPGSTPEMGAPLGYMEALAAGLSVVARSTTDVARGLRDAGTGVTVDDLCAVPEAVGVLSVDSSAPARCRAEFEARYTEGAWRDRVLALYGGLRDGMASVRRAP